MARPQIRALAGIAALAFAAACSDSPVASRGPEPSTGLTRLNCTVTVASGTLTCSPSRPASGASLDRIYGGQDTYVKLTSSGTAYDGSQYLTSNVTVQNLLQKSIGRDAASTLQGVKVFFNSGPTVTSGTGSVSIANADGTGTFTGSNQPYFLYSEELQPYQISASRQWIFDLPNTVLTFSFTVLISAPQADETVSMLDRVWNGLTSTDWFTASNWNGAVPDSATVAAIPNATTLGSANMPVLTADARVGAVRVGTGSTLGLGGFTLTADATVDAPGTISNGKLLMQGAGSLVRGSIPSTLFASSTALQGSVVASGAVSVTGSLTISGGNAMSIAIP